MNTRMTETAWSLLQSWRSHISHKCWFAGKTLPSQGSTCKLLAEHYLARASLVAQLVKNSPAMQDTWVRSLGLEDPLEKGMVIHTSILAWRIPWTA